MTTNKPTTDVPPMLPMHRAEDSLIGFARAVLCAMADDDLTHTNRLAFIALAAENHKLATRPVTNASANSCGRWIDRNRIAGRAD